MEEYYCYYSCLCGEVRNDYMPDYNPHRKCPKCGYRPIFLHGQPTEIKEGEILATTARPRTKVPARKDPV